MMSWLIISGTNRKNSLSLKVANAYQQMLSQKNIASELIALENFQNDFFNINSKSDELIKVQNDLLHPSQKIIFIAAEYNGSFPGSLKLFMDCCNPKLAFWDKKAALIGISDGRNGNIRGLDQLTGILNYLKINVLHYKVNIPFVNKAMNENFER